MMSPYCIGSEDEELYVYNTAALFVCSRNLPPYRSSALFIIGVDTGVDTGLVVAICGYLLLTTPPRVHCALPPIGWVWLVYTYAKLIVNSVSQCDYGHCPSPLPSTPLPSSPLPRTEHNVSIKFPDRDTTQKQAMNGDSVAEPKSPSPRNVILITGRQENAEAAKQALLVRPQNPRRHPGDFLTGVPPPQRTLGCTLGLSHWGLSSLKEPYVYPGTFSLESLLPQRTPWDFLTGVPPPSKNPLGLSHWGPSPLKEPPGTFSLESLPPQRTLGLGLDRQTYRSIM